jgi:DNA-directed RNA polymerase specialized sigma24 family protein
MATDDTGLAARRRDDLSALVTAAGAGDGRAWEVLADRLSRLTWRTCMAYGLTPPEARRTSRLVWLRFADRLSTRAATRSATTWIYDATAQECRTVIALAPRPDPPPALEGVDPDMQRAHGELPVRDRVLLTLLDDGAFSYREIGEILGMPLGSIGPTRRRCLHRLRRMTETRT